MASLRLKTDNIRSPVPLASISHSAKYSNSQMRSAGHLSNLSRNP
jgi:hypothetical protein